MNLKNISLGSLILLAAASGWSERPCGGAVNSVYIEGPYSVSALAVNNHRMVTADREFTLTSWDLDDPDAPTVGGRWTLWDETYDSNNLVLLDRRGFAYEKRAWQFYDEFTLRIWDLRDPSNPVPVADAPGGWVNAFVDDRTIVGSFYGLKIVDVSDPFHPVLVCDDCADLDLPDLPPAVSGVYLKVGKAGRYAVLLEWNTVLVVDYSDPSTPVQIGSAITNNYYYGTSEIWADEGVAVLSDGSGGIEIVDLSDPTRPVVTDPGVGFYYPWWGLVHGRTLFVEEGGLIRRLDLSDPSAPVELEPVESGYVTRHAAAWKDRLYVATHDGVRTLDIENDLAELGRTESAQAIEGVAASGDAAIAVGHHTLRVFDLSDSMVPDERGRLVIDGWLRNADLDGRLGAAYALDGSAVLIDIDDRDRPGILSMIDYSLTYVFDLEIKAGRLYLAGTDENFDGMVEVWDVSDPEDPTLFSTITQPGRIYEVEALGNRLFVGGEAELVEIDLTQPSSPLVLSTLTAVAPTGLATVGDDLLFASGVYFGLAMIDISEPGAPELLDFLEPYYGVPSWLESEGDRVVGSDGTSVYLISPAPDSETFVLSELWSAQGIGHGGVSGGVATFAGGNGLKILDLGCRPPEPDFDWFQMGTQIQFIDRTTWAGPVRDWVWAFSQEPYEAEPRNPLVDFVEPGTIEVTLQVETESGTGTVTKTVEVVDPPGLSGPTRASGGRVRP